ncbi:MAG: VWA domain-containing protein, partial [Acidobacteriales bacterium]|nr:VWA domain-containing protein [Terriglobales bacterium]
MALRLDASRSGISGPIRLFAILLGLAMPFTLALPGFGQGSEIDVHITPQKEPEKPKQPEIDPSLKTHTKPIKVDVDLVLINVTVTDPMNRLVTGLEVENFVLFEGNSKQQIKHFSSEDAPISLGVIFDISGSMKDKIDKAREAVVEFFRTANPH